MDQDKRTAVRRVLQHTIQSDIVVEVVQSRQVGITVRALEAMFYHKS